MPAPARVIASDAATLASDARIVAIDPGLDAAGIAVYTLAGYTGSSDVHALARQFVEVSTIRTLPGMPLPFRLQLLSERVDVVCEVYRPAVVYVEQPRIAGTYQRNRQTTGRDGMAAQMAKLHMAMGAIVAAATAHAPVELVHAPAMKKDQRHLLSVAILRLTPAYQGTKRPRLPSKDALDAVWLGAQQLTGEIALACRRRGAPPLPHRSPA